MKVYCSKCNLEIPIRRTVRKDLGKVIVDVIDPHVCSEVPIPLSVKPEAIPTFSDIKFVQNSNELPTGMRSSRIIATEPGDRRPNDQIKGNSSAPLSVLDQIKGMTNSVPANDIDKDPDSGA
jgi:hypothetical protein